MAQSRTQTCIGPHQHQGGQYVACLDLRQHGYQATLYFAGGFGRGRGAVFDKVVLHRVSQMTFWQMEDLLQWLFATDVSTLLVQRIDLAVDIVGYPVAWFRDHAYVARVRSGGEIGKVPCGVTVANGVETLYFGKRPNLFRIYDKIAEQHARGIRQGAERFMPLSPDGLVGLPKGACLTRVERQYGGAGVPAELRSLGAVARNAADYSPFEKLRFRMGSGFGAIPADVSGAKFLKVLGMRALTQTLGYQGAVMDLNRRTHGKGQRIVRGLFPYFNDEVEAPDLGALYRDAVLAQFGSGEDAGGN